MKCEGSENPPCIRCRKVGRECVPQTSSRQKGPVETQRFDATTSQVSKVSSRKEYNILGGRDLLHVSRSSYNVRAKQNGCLLVQQHVSRDSSTVPIPRPQTHNFRFLPDPRPRSADHRPANDLVIPSIYSTPPVDAVLEPRFKPSSSSSSPRPVDSTLLRKRKRQSTYSPSNDGLTPVTSSLEVDRSLLSRAEMKEMIQL